MYTLFPSFSTPTLLHQTYTKRLLYAHPNISCKANHDHHDHPKNIQTNRRNMLINLTSAAAAVTGLNPIHHYSALSSPIKAPNISDCQAPDLPTGIPEINCCPPDESLIIDFHLLPPPSTIRIRQPAHLVDKSYITKYARAVELMKSLPADDPRNFYQQAKVHCAYCDLAYQQVGCPNLKIQVHGCWLFAPFHRWYLYFHEKILGKLIGDESFALPFWNWDNPRGGMRMPGMYLDSSLSLYDEFRNEKHLPPTVIDLNYDGTDRNVSDEVLIDQNLKLMYRQMISNAKTAELFLGAPYRTGDDPNPGPGALDIAPHGPVHTWTGDPDQPNTEDMGVFYSAARDPIFYSHHSNVDRLWEVWRKEGGKHQNYKEKDFREAEFLFYDEEARLVRVKVKDCLDFERLGYKYKDVDNPWLNTPPIPKTRKPTKQITKEATYPLSLGKSPVSSTVKRPKISRSQVEKENEEEILIINGIEYNSNEYVKFDVYVNAPVPRGIGPESREFAGSFVHVPHSSKSMMVKSKIKFGITDLIDDCGVDGDETVIVTLVLRCGDVKVEGVQIQLSG